MSQGPALTKFDTLQVLTHTLTIALNAHSSKEPTKRGKMSLPSTDDGPTLRFMQLHG